MANHEERVERPLDEPWVGPDYRSEHSAVLILDCTYWDTTKVCMERFLDGDHDQTFRKLNNAMATYLINRPSDASADPVDPARAETLSRPEIWRGLAVLNYIYNVRRDNADKPDEKDYLASEEVVKTRLSELKPKVAWLLGQSHWRPRVSYLTFEKFKGSRVLMELLGIKQVCTNHPASMWGSSIQPLIAGWADVQRLLRQ
jgi:hypothetical protein